MATKVWKNEKGEMFHNACFEEGESKDGYTPVDLNNDVVADDDCTACGVGLLLAPDPDEDDDDDDEDED